MLPTSFIEIQNQILGAVAGINGTPFSLHYSSDRIPSYQSGYTRIIPVSGRHVAADLERIELEIDIAGQHFIKTFPPEPNQTYSFTWDGKDVSGRQLSGKQPLTIRTNYIYPQPEFNQSKSGTTALGTWNAIAQGMGGWTLNVHHAYDVVGKTLYFGHGQRRTTEVIDLDGEIAIPSEGGGQFYIFDQTGRHLRTISTLTKALIYRFEYDEDGYVKAITDSDSNTTQIERNAEGLPLAIIAPYGQRTSVDLNSDRYLASITNPANETSQFSYIREGLLTSFTDPKGNLYRFEYDELGRLHSRQEPDGSFDLLSRTATENGFMVAKITATGRESTYLTERFTTGEERQVNKGCGGTGEIVALTAKNGTETINYPDGSTFIQEQQPDPRFGKQVPMVKRTVFKTPSGLEANLEMTRSCILTNPKDPLSLTKLTDTVSFNGRTSTTTFDAENQQITYQSPAGRQSVLHLDERGRVLKTETAGLESVSFNYDDRGRLISAMQGDQTILNYSYDQEGRLSSLGNAEGNQVQYSYDQVGRIIQTTLPSGRTYKFAYDANSNLTHITVPSGAVHTLNYNSVNMESGYVPPENPAYASIYDSEQQLTNSTMPSGRTVQGVYNQSGDLEKATYPEATIDVTYEKESKRVTKLVRTPENRETPQEMTFTYDGGLVTEMAWSGVANGTYRYRYDNNFSLVGMQLDDEPEIEMKRDADGLLTQYGQFQVDRDRATGAPTQITDGKMKVDIEYDNSGRVISRTNLVNGRLIYQLQLSYDLLSRIVQKRETVTDTTHVYDYTYDPDGQLILVKCDGEVVERYVYDDNGNRTEWQLGSDQHSASYDAQDRLIELDGTPYEFDADGFLMQRGDMTLEYSATGELLEVSWPDGKAINYTYDSMNRRVARTDEKGTEQYLYGNPNHPFQVTAVRDASGKLSVYEYDDFGSLMSIRGESSLYGVITDQLGTPQVVFDKIGEVVKAIKYNSFGQAVGNSNPEFVLPISFAGGLVDSETKLVRFGFRDYDSDVGKWTAKDPILFLSSDFNFYGYVINDPINLIDPLGLNAIDPLGLNAIAILGFIAKQKADKLYKDGTKIAQESGLVGAHNGFQDAYRHCVTSCLGTVRDGVLFATALGEMNEIKGDIEHGQLLVERIMDTHNNKCGRNYGVQIHNSKGTESDCQIQCMQGLRSNKLIILE